MQEEIERILNLDIPSTSKLILIYIKLKGEGCVSQTELASKISCSPSGLIKCSKKLEELGYLEVDRNYRQNYYKVLI